MNLDELCADLLAERVDLVTLVGSLDDDGWRTPTPAPGWSILDQVTHLAWFDDAATRAIVDPAAFRVERDQAIGDVDGLVDRATAECRHLGGREALAWLETVGERLATVALDAGPSVRVPWYGPDMTVASSVTARVMETWAHGQDVADALGVQRTPTARRLRHVAFLGWRALPHSFRANGRPVPEAPVRVEVGAWSFGPDDATNVVRGPLLDFCLVVTRRRHPADTALVAEGTVAAEWLTIAQAFAGPPGEGRRPGQFS